MPFTPLGNGNLDFGSLVEALNALQRNPQQSRAYGVGAQSVTGSVIYGVALDSGTVTITDISASKAWGVAAPGISFPFGLQIPEYLLSPGAAVGGSITVTPSNLSTVHWALIYK